MQVKLFLLLSCQLTRNLQQNQHFLVMTIPALEQKFSLSAQKHLQHHNLFC